jgi:hypothetical protein
MKKTPVINLNAPDIEVTNPDDYEEPEMFVVVEEPQGQKFCDHATIRVYPHHRVIKCRKCQATIDPFDYILLAGRASNNFLTHIKYLKIQMDRMAKEHDDLMKVNNKLKKQTR